MIRGYFVRSGGRARPFVSAMLELPAVARSLGVRFLVDTGADRTVLASADARRLAVDLQRLPKGPASRGVGGRVLTRATQAVLRLDSLSLPINLAIFASPAVGPPSPAMPSLLGRDVISRFALFVEERTDRVLLLEPHEADSLALP